MDTLSKQLKVSLKNHQNRNVILKNNNADHFSYAGLYERSIRVANHLKKSNLGKCATIIMRSPEKVLIAALGCIWCNIPFQILDPSLLSAQSGLTLLPEDSFLILEQASKVIKDRQTVTLHDIVYENASEIEIAGTPSETLFYTLLFCETNRYQKVFYSETDMLQYVFRRMNRYAIQKQDVLLFLTPTIDIVCMPVILTGLLAGASIAFAADILQGLDVLSSGRVRHIFAAPDMLKSLADAGDKQDFLTLRNILLSAGEQKVDPTLLHRCKAVNRSANVYVEQAFGSINGLRVDEDRSFYPVGLHERAKNEEGKKTTHNLNLYGVFFDTSWILSRISRIQNVEQCCAFTDGQAGKKKLQVFLLIKEVDLKHDIFMDISKIFPPYVKLDFYFTSQREVWPGQFAPKEELLAVCEAYRSQSEPVIGQEDPIYQALYTMWKDLLKSKNIQREDKFFDVGGNSFLITKLFTQIKKKFSIKMDLMDLYRNNALGEMCEFVRERYEAVEG